MNKWKSAFFVSLALLVVVSCGLLYAVIDQGVSLTYMQVSYDDQVQANTVLGDLVVMGGQEYSQKDLVHLLRQEYPDAFIVEDGETISIGSNSFYFSHDRLESAR
jgi:hypothetical protein